MELATTVGHQWHTIFLINPTNPPHQHTFWFVDSMMPAQATRQIAQPREMDGDGQETWSAKPPIVSTRSPGPSAIVSPGPRRRNRGPEDAGNAEEAVPRPAYLMDGTFDEKHEATLAYATMRRAALTPFLPTSTIFSKSMRLPKQGEASVVSVFHPSFLSSRRGRRENGQLRASVVVHQGHLPPRSQPFRESKCPSRILPPTLTHRRNCVPSHD